MTNRKAAALASNSATAPAWYSSHKPIAASFILLQQEAQGLPEMGQPLLPLALLVAGLNATTARLPRAKPQQKLSRFRSPVDLH
jgi:hypothetical protein